MAIAAGTPEVPMMMSTFSSSISFLALRPAVVGIGGVVEDGEHDLAAGDLRPVGDRRLHALGVGHAERGVRAGERDAQADLQVGGERGGGEGSAGEDADGAADEVTSWADSWR